MDLDPDCEEEQKREKRRREKEERRGGEVHSDNLCLFHLLLQVEYLSMPQCPTRKHWKSFSLPLFLSPPLCLFHSLSACLLASYVKKRAVHLIKNKVNKIQAKPVRHNIPHIPLWGWMHASVNCKISSFLRVARYVFLSHKALKEKKSQSKTITASLDDSHRDYEC